MIHAASALFLALLAIAHLGDPSATDRPLSLFREAGPAVGYPLFALLALIGCLHLRTYYRLGLHRDLWAPASLLALLAAVAVTPSGGGLHDIAALVLLGFVFGWYAVRLHQAGSLWLFAHLAAPVVFLILTAARSYGLWQKLLVVYFLIASNLDCLLATGGVALPGPDDFRLGRRRRRRASRRVVYEPRVIWRRSDKSPR